MKLIAIVTGLALIIGGCTSVTSTVTSDYTDLGSAEVFRYGNFCGPKIPEGQMILPPDDRVAYLDSIQPKDTLDMACAAHDKCYAEFGEDLSYCDAMLIELLTPWAPYTDPSKHPSGSIDSKESLRQSMANSSALQFTARPNPDGKREYSCRYLANEMIIPFAARMKKTRKHPAEGSPVDLRLEQIKEKSGGLASGLSKGVFTGLGGGIRLLQGGSFRDFSPEEGTCIANWASTQDRLVRGLSMYRLAAINGGCNAQEIADGSMSYNTCGISTSTENASRLTFQDMVGLKGYSAYVEPSSK